MAWRDILPRIDGLIDAVQSLYATANDPDDALRDIENDLLRFRETFLEANRNIEENPPGAPLEIPPPFDPNDRYFVRPTPPEFRPPPADPVHPISFVAGDESELSIQPDRNAGLLGFAVEDSTRTNRIGGLFGGSDPQAGMPSIGTDFLGDGYRFDWSNMLPSGSWPQLPFYPGVLPRISN
jgi:hypothetical protein